MLKSAPPELTPAGRNEYYKETAQPIVVNDVVLARRVSKSQGLYEPASVLSIAGDTQRPSYTIKFIRDGQNEKRLQRQRLVPMYDDSPMILDTYKEPWYPYAHDLDKPYTAVDEDTRLHRLKYWKMYAPNIHFTQDRELQHIGIADGTPVCVICRQDTLGLGDHVERAIGCCVACAQPCLYCQELLNPNHDDSGFCKRCTAVGHNTFPHLGITTEGVLPAVGNKLTNANVVLSIESDGRGDDALQGKVGNQAGDVRETEDASGDGDALEKDGATVKMKVWAMNGR